MKIFGHPVHVMLIHFPSALFPMDLVCSFIASRGITPELMSASAFYASCGAVVFGYLAIITGVVDLLMVSKRKPGVIPKILYHGGINASVVLVYTILVLRSYKLYPYIPTDETSTLIFKAVLMAGLFAGNYIGGSLILKDKIGVQEN